MYLKINDIDYSKYVNELNITSKANYNGQINAAGNQVVDYINSKRTIEVGIVPIEDDVMKQLQTALEGFSVSISFRNPKTGLLEEKIACIIPQTNIKYYFIKADRVLFKAFKLKFVEL